LAEVQRDILQVVEEIPKMRHGYLPLDELFSVFAGGEGKGCSHGCVPRGMRKVDFLSIHHMPELY
jgi:hypothetical protein